MNVQYSLIREIIRYEFELSHNAAETTKNNWDAKDECTVDQNRESRWFNKFCSDFKSLDDLARSSRSKTVDSIDANMASSTQRVSGELGISHNKIVRLLQASGATELCYKTAWSARL